MKKHRTNANTDSHRADPVGPARTPPMSIARLTFVLSALTLSACTETGDPGLDDTAAAPDSGDPSDSADTSDSTDTSDSADTSTPGAELGGSWATACYKGTQTVLTYDGSSFSGTYGEYSDAACTDLYHLSEWSGTATFGEELASGARKIDLAFLTFTSTALTEENAAQNNAYAYCGYTDWEAGVTKDVLGAECWGFSIPVGGQSLDIYLVEGDTLRFGVGAAIGTALTEADRPTEIDDTRVFTRVQGG